MSLTPEDIAEAQSWLEEELIYVSGQVGDIFRPTHSQDSVGAMSWSYPMSPVAADVPIIVNELSPLREEAFRKIIDMEKVHRPVELQMAVGVEIQEGDRVVSDGVQYEVRRVNDKETHRLLQRCVAVRFGDIG